MVEFFEREIQNIESEDLRNFVRFFFANHAGAWFWESGASSSGKHHPKFAQGKGGLVRHTRAAAWFLEELLRLSPYAYMRAEYKDYARVAILLHDTRKYGDSDTENKDCYKYHGALAATAVRNAWWEFFGADSEYPELLLMAIRSHMGQWTEDRDDRPFTDIDRLVHMADYMASRPFIDIPELTAQYAEDEEEDEEECFEPGRPVIDIIALNP